MQKNSNKEDLAKNDSFPTEQSIINPEEDGRNKEWQDRARVNLEEVPEGTQTSVERDFEPENPVAEDEKNKKEIIPPY